MAVVSKVRSASKRWKKCFEKWVGIILQGACHVQAVWYWQELGRIAHANDV